MWRVKPDSKRTKARRSSTGRRTQYPARRRRQPSFEPLEERTLLSLSSAEPLGSLAPEGDLAPSAFAAASSVTYKIYDQWGGTWHDAEKKLSDLDDDLLCWAAASSNVLAWSGWDSYAGYSDTYDIFDHFQDHWEDKGGVATYGWDWWFAGNDCPNPGSDWAHVNVAGGGNFFPGVNLSQYSKDKPVAGDALDTISSYLQGGYGVTLG